MKTRSLFPLAGALLALTLPALAADWPQWRGPNRDDVSRETGLLKIWPKDGPPLLWTYEDGGQGYSGPAVVGDRLYTLGGDGAKTFVYALDTGKHTRLWSTEIGDFFKHNNGSGPRGTPTVDGDLLYVLTGGGDLACVETATGEKRWQKNLKKDFGGQQMSGWGYAESPLVDGDRVVCTPGGKNGAILALNKKTGDLLWRTADFTDPAGYSSIVVSEAGGVRQYVQQTGQSVVGVAPRDGKLLWRFPRNSPTAAIPTPVCRGDDVYVTSGYRAGCALLQIRNEDGTLKPSQVYANANMVNHHGGVVLVGDHVYGYSDGRGWVCQDFKTGDVAWSSKQLGKGSVTCADGRLYCYSEDGGILCLIEASPDGWKEQGRFTIPRQSKLNVRKTWTHPVVADGRLYLRDQNLIFCYDVTDHAASAQ